MNYKSMGVINLTPNSFSDGGKYNHPQKFANKFEALISWADIIDIGAESSAPFNSAISFDEEWKRYSEIFFPYLKNNKDPKVILSIDTYKVDIFRKVAQQVQNYWPNTKLIFNDISGKIDTELLDFFEQESKTDSPIKFSYVFCHNLCPSRNLSLKHMDYCSSDTETKLLESMQVYFKQGLKQIPAHVDVYIDPCFGFSKTREQNHYLLKRFSKFMNAFSLDQIFVYGISKKSFLRFPKEMDISIKENSGILDQMQAIIFYSLINNKNKNFIFRVHDSTSISALQNIKKIFAL